VDHAVQVEVGHALLVVIVVVVVWSRSLP
jgi:hypothetical protein